MLCECNWKNVLTLILGMVAVACTVMLFVAAVVVWLGYFTCTGNLAAIESIRADVVNIRREQSHEVIGLAVRANAVIHWHQAMNQSVYTAWGIPNAWDDVKPIKLHGLFRDDAKPTGEQDAGPMGYVPAGEPERERTIDQIGADKGKGKPAGEVPK